MLLVMVKKKDKNVFGRISLHYILTRHISAQDYWQVFFAKVAMKYLQTLANHIYPKFQCSFKSEQSTIDMIFSFKQLQEKSWEQNGTFISLFLWILPRSS